MDHEELLANAVTVEEHSLHSIQQWLQYGKHSWSIGAGIFWISYGWILLALKIIALVFTPYMIYHLYQARWYKSVFVLLTVVVLPFGVFQFLEVDNNILGFVLSFFPFLALYLFCYIISYMIGEELIKIKTLRAWEREKKSG